MVTNDYLSDALNFTSNRRLVFVKMFQKIGREFGVNQPPEEAVAYAMECIHASATIIDDMLDNECLRKDLPSYYVRHGGPVAAFAALNLMVKGIEAISGHVIEMRGTLEVIRCMIDAEEADVGLRRRAPSASPLEWYMNVVSRKIACELILILNVSMQGVPAAEGMVAALSRSTLRLGQLIQFCDDWYDLLIRDPFASTGEDAGYVLTYSLPLALYMCAHGNDFETLLGVRMDRQMASRVVGVITAEPIKSAVESFIEDEHRKLIESLQLLPASWAAEFAEIAIAVRSPQYWERKYYELA
jgi:geranylgeranyl pyrophosphate synthase